MKNILVIGGTSGIGFEIVSQLQKENRVFYTGREEKSTETNKDSTFIPFDATTDEHLDTSSLPESLEGLVYCPGSINLRPFKNIKLESFKADLQVNLLGAIKSIQSVLPKLSASGQSSIVLFSTVAVQTGMPFHASVAAAKGAVEGLTRSLAAEFAPKIRVNAIAPSLVNTPLAEKFLNNDVKMEKANARHPLGRIGTPAEIATAALFLLGNESAWMTGQILRIDGGIGSLKT